jgi:acyl-CoA synthetase (AMP-forming)/AMP-acid ligase II
MSETSQFDILSLLEAQVVTRKDRVAIETSDGRALSYLGLYESVTRVALGIRDALGNSVNKSLRIGIVMPNGLNMAVALLGVSCAGAAIPFNPTYKPFEFDSYFRLAKIDALLIEYTDDGPAVAVAERLGLRLLRFSLEEGISGASNKGRLLPRDPDDVALVLMTSGSTGRPKLVPLTHRNVCVSAGDVCRSMNLSTEDRCLSMWEQYHIGGLVDLLLAPLASGGTVICTSGFSASEFYRLLAVARPTWFQAVPTTLNELIVHSRRNGAASEPKSLRFIRSVSAALPPRMHDELETLFGVPVLQTFGMTEAGPLITSTRLPPAVRKPGSVGSSCGTEIRIVDSKGAALGPDVGGEVAIRGPNVFSGYEDATDGNKTQFRGGWFHTGDLGYFDFDGDLFLTGRVKQLINRGGEKFSPNEIEEVLLLHPAVAEAAAFAVEHPTLGEDVCAAIVLREPARVEDIRSFVAARLAAFKVPKRIDVRHRLPVNPIGKIDKLALVESYHSLISDSRAFVPPRNGLEKLLIQIWSDELPTKFFGIHDDFMILGGDSLSSTRVLLAVEKALSATIPGDIVEMLTTVSSLADYLCQQGFGKELAAQVDNQESENESDKTSDEEELSTKRLGDLDFLCLRLCACSSVNELRIINDYATVYRTPRELAQLSKKMQEIHRIGIKNIIEQNTDELKRGKCPCGSGVKFERCCGSQSGNTLENFPFFEVHGGVDDLRRELICSLQEELEGAGPAMNWLRQATNCDVIYYKSCKSPSDGKTLVVGFSGNMQRLMIPTYRLLLCLDPEKFDLLVLRDRARKCFLGGIEGMGADIDTIANCLRDLTANSRYASVITFGTSGGALPAIYVALKNSFSKAVAVGVASPARFAILADKLRAVIAQNEASSRTRLVLAYSSAIIRDDDSARQVSAIAPWAERMENGDGETHNLLHDLFQRGELKVFLNEIIADTRSS